MFRWTLENEVLTTPPNFSLTKHLMFIFVRCHKAVRRVVISSKKSSKWSFGQVKWTFDTNKAKNFGKSPKILCPMSETDKKQFFSKNFFFLKNTFLWAHWMQFWQPGWFLRGNANRFCSISDADKLKRNRKVFFFRKKIVFYKMF